MNQLVLLVSGLFLSLFFWASSTKTAEHVLADEYKQILSEYNFFEGKLSDFTAAKGTEFYDLNTPLFSDYAFKLRHIRLPEGQSMRFNEKGEIDFPLGSYLIKTFYYPKDFRKPQGEKQLIETRILFLEEKGWTPLNYIWNKEQSEAFLDVGSHDVPVSWIDEEGKEHSITYMVPNLSLCKACHVHGRKMVPLGPVTKQLNHIDGLGNNQLKTWADKGMLSNFEKNPEELPRLAVWNKPETGSLEQRARAWLDVNCAHCHKRRGSAQITGLLLNSEITDPDQLGINKVPMSTSLANEAMPYDIVPGHPEKSLLIYRIIAEDPGLKMPKIACSAYDKEGVELLKDWIRSLK